MITLQTPWFQLFQTDMMLKYLGSTALKKAWKISRNFKFLREHVTYTY